MTIESTTRLVTCELDGQKFPARVWEGTTDSGVPVVCLVTRVAVPKDRPAADFEQFEQELKECKDPSRMAVQAYDLRTIL